MNSRLVLFSRLMMLRRSHPATHTHFTYTWKPLPLIFAKEDKEKSSERKNTNEEDDDDNNESNNGNGGNENRVFNAITGMAIASFCVLLLMKFWKSLRFSSNNEISWQQFRDSIIGKHSIDKLVIVDESYVQVYTSGSSTPIYWFTIPNSHEFDARLIDAYAEKDIPASQLPNVENNRNVVDSLLSVVPQAIWLLVIIRLIRQASTLSSSMMGGNVMSMKVNKSKNVKVGFKDVAGMQEAKQEIMEFVTFLKSPEKYTKLGAKFPNGAILMGPPGTGKTLLAKAVAGESGVPFYSVSGSDFVEMYVGVGAGRIRSLFKKARENEKAIIYIDEIDAIARPRGKGVLSGANDERESTLNQLLVEMDGFQKQQGHIIVLASTNVPKDELDSALMRPGRFDRSIYIEKPEIKERLAIFKLHLCPLKLQTREEMIKSDEEQETQVNEAGSKLSFEIPKTTPSEEEMKNSMPNNVTTENDLLVIHRFAERMSYLTPGFVGADIANICNEAALVAARDKSTTIGLKHLEKALDRVIGGIEKKARVLSDFEKKVVSYHEAGHAVVGWFLKYCDPVMKISIVPRGSKALGYTQMLPQESAIYTDKHLFDRICVLLGGRVAELLQFGHLSTGASDDLQRVTQLAYMQVSQFGMYPGAGHVSYPSAVSGDSLSKLSPYSDEIAQQFDVEAKKLVDRAFQRTKELLEEKKMELKRVAEYLEKYEVITREELERMIGARPFTPGTHPDDEVQVTAP